jgi:hypothetical protein
VWCGKNNRLKAHTRDGAADHVESQVVQRFEADAIFTHVEQKAFARGYGSASEKGIMRGNGPTIA